MINPKKDFYGMPFSKNLKISHMQLVFATGNNNKIREANDLLNSQSKIKINSLEQMGILEEIPETGKTIEENAILKAKYVFDNYAFNCFSEDTGLEVDFIGGKPGVHSARFAGPERNNEANMSLLLELLGNSKERAAHFKTVICLIIDGEKFLFEGVAKGEILMQGKGEKGFGYDPIFQPAGYNKSFAEMSIAEKSEISHRGIALRKLMAFLEML